MIKDVPKGLLELRAAGIENAFFSLQLGDQDDECVMRITGLVRGEPQWWTLTIAGWAIPTRGTFDYLGEMLERLLKKIIAEVGA